MGKAKKGKRSGKDDDMESDVNIEEQSVSESVKRKSKSRDHKKNEGDDVDEIVDNLEVLKIDKQKGKKGKKSKRIDDDSEDEQVPSKLKNKSKKEIFEEEFGTANIDNLEELKVDKQKGKKGKKSKRIDDDSEDEQVPSKPKNKSRKEIFVEEFGTVNIDDLKELKVDEPKGKKGKKSRFDDDSEDEQVPSKPESKSKKEIFEEEFGSANIDDDDDLEELKINKPKGKKGKKSRRVDDSEDEQLFSEPINKIQKEIAEVKLDAVDIDDIVDDLEESKVDKSKGKKGKKSRRGNDESDDEQLSSKNKSKKEIVEEEFGTVKTAAQKKKEKKEREKQKKLALKKAEIAKKGENGQASKEVVVEEKNAVVEKTQELPEEDGKKKKKGVKDDLKEKAKGPRKKMIAAMQEALKQAKEDEERAKREEEEKILEEEMREKARLEQLQLEQERREKKKLKEKQRKERLKAEGKLLTTKQKQDRARAQAMLEALKAQGLEIPEAGEKKSRPRPSVGTRIRPNKLKQQTSTEDKDEKIDENKPEQVQLEIVDQQPKEAEKKDDEVKDSWDAESSEEEPEDDKSEEAAQIDKKTDETKESSYSETESGSESESESEEESEDESIDEKLTDAEKKRERARLRIQMRRVEAEKEKNLENLRAAVVCVLGHVDTGKTKILDKLRRTNVQDGEAGGITQQIGATNVPIDAIQDSTKHVKGYADKEFKIPGLLIIDTPGHESFSNLRNRGSSLCDIAVLVVDIMHGLEPQTIESIGLLKTKKCPFVVALNKIDRLYDWQTMNRKDVQDIIKAQAFNTQREFEKRSKDVIVQFAEQGLNAALFYENPDPRSYVSLVPTSAITGEGMGNLLALIVDACQGPLAKRLMYSEELQATVLEVKALPGLGTTIDCILVNGTLREGDTMIVAGTDGPIVTQIRSLLMPQPLKELRVKNAYIEYREIKAAQGVKIAAKDLEKAIAGLNLVVAQKPDEVDLLKEEIAKELSKALGNIKLAERGVFVQASTLGALEALLDFLRSSKIPYAGIRIGPVVKKDVMKASIMLEHDSQYATILAFDVKIERDAQELADTLGVKIFQADIIYHLFDKFTAFREELKQRKRDENKHIAVFPCKLRVLPQFIFNSRDPIVMGVMVEAGIVKEGTPVCVPSKEFVELGVVTSIEYNHKTVESARKGQEVCVKIEPIPGEAPKMFGRHFDEKDFIISKISRQSIDACKDYFRDDLSKPDWQLMVELKKLFQIL